MTRTIIASKQSQRAEAPMLPGECGAEELSDARSPARLIERVIVEYSRAWRGARSRARSQVAAPPASGTC